LSLVSHTPDLQTRMPTAAVHVFTSEGSDGSGVPLSSLGMHMPVPPVGALHHSLGEQSASVWQPVMQSPLPVSQMLPLWPWQSESAAHLPHSPTIGPERKQNGSPVVSQACGEPEPLSPSHGTHFCVLVLQIGFSAGQSAEVEHSTHVLVIVLQFGLAPGHCEFISHSTHLPMFAPEEAQMVERQTVPPLPASHGPSPLA
jgi:hypothetical protein